MECIYFLRGAVESALLNPIGVGAAEHFGGE
jgi:hypothetical protein